MTQGKLLIAQNIDNQYLDKIKSMIPDWEIIVGKDRSIWEPHFKEADVILCWQNSMKELFLKEETKLQWVQTWSAGVNSLPLETLHKRNVFVTNASGVHAYPISETIFALMLALTRKIDTYVKNQAEKKWDNKGISLEIHEKTIGVIGVGAIGKETAKIAKAFGMKVLGIRHSGRAEDYVDAMYTTNQLNEVLPQCDYVVVTLPLTKETYHLFGKNAFQQMKSSAFFINIGRGEIVDEPALIEALRNSEIAGAGLDVFETEPLPENSPLWEFNNVILTPHTSGSTEFYAKRVIENIFIPNFQDFLDKNTPAVNLVDFQKGY
ncbi:D-2-hydroxyacid dehydrogenase [Bacillaceae bacterium Marseille-Q3522]|nr:D-2-hydroxyacid dehydrogenase [Bacillaceae bacterium Marseille-Q3522]